MLPEIDRKPAGRGGPVLRCAPVLALGAALLSGCATSSAGTAGSTPPAAGSGSSTDPTEGAALTAGSEAPSYGLCAEFPPVPPTGRGDLEGWWSSTPANPDGSVIEDPADWPEPKMVAHPRTAVVDVESGEVLSTWDRTTCSGDPSFVPVPNDQWPAITRDSREFVVVDMDSHEVVATTLASPY
jgi:hypothetical protein